ncbi:MAG: methylmalonyl Co-A mutase-associated GTPase MeaB [Sphingomonadales bacterium]|nr:methylmalonyl Co-A mutase-associated GTPase MeaB [Sphingomonadales bacterium]
MSRQFRAGDLLQGQPLAIARAISAVENGSPDASQIVRLIQPHLGNAFSIGVTGPPGCGKSTLISAMVSELSGRGKRIAIIAVDPTSPISGGAVLGDRVRMAAHSRNPNVFIRSLATNGHLGGLTRMTSTVIDILDAGGMDAVIIETVGTGQSEIDIADMADVRLVICPPGLGDEMQAIKAGILEIADILLVNKSDLPGAEATALQLENMLHDSSGGRQRRVMRTSASTGSGVADLVNAILGRVETLAASRSHAKSGASIRAKRMLATHAATLVERYVRNLEGSGIDAICSRLQSGEATLESAAHEILGIFPAIGGMVAPKGSAEERPANGA